MICCLALDRVWSFIVLSRCCYHENNRFVCNKPLVVLFLVSLGEGGRGVTSHTPDARPPCVTHVRLLNNKCFPGPLHCIRPYFPSIHSNVVGIFFGLVGTDRICTCACAYQIFESNKYLVFSGYNLADAFGLSRCGCIC